MDSDDAAAPPEAGSGRPGPGDSRLWRYPWSVVAAPVVVLAGGLLGRALYAPADGNQLFIPWFLVSARSWLSGHLPTWNPWAQSGMPLLGSSQAGTLYPPNLLFVVAPVVLANNLSILVTLVVAGLGAWLLGRRLTGDRVAAAVGGAGFGVCTFFFAHIGHQSLIAGAAWLPWMLYGYELVRERVTPARLAVPAVAVAMAVLSGHSQMLFSDLALAAVYVVAGEVPGGPRTAVRNGLVALAAVAAGLALGAVQLWPTVLVAASSVRQRLPYGAAMSASLPVRQLPMVLFPYLFGKAVPGGPFTQTYGGTGNLTELTGYPGMVILVLASAGVLALRRERPARAVLVTGLVAVLLALGPATPLSRVLYGIPPFGEFRAWGRFIAGFDLAVAMLAAYGTAVLRGHGAAGRRNGVLVALATAAATGLAALVLPRLGAVKKLIPGGHPAAAALWIPCAFAAGGALASLALRRGCRVIPLVVLVAIVADSFFSFAAYYDWREASPSPALYAAELSPTTPFPQGWGGVAAEPGGIGRYLYIGASLVPVGADFVDLTDARDERSVNSTNVLMFEDYSLATGVREDGSDVDTTDLWQPTSHVFDLLRVTTVLLNPVYAFGGPPREPGKSLLTGGVDAGSGLLRFTYQPKLPEAFLVGGTTRTTFAQALAALHGDVAFDPSSVGLVDQPCPACPNGAPGSAGSAGPVTWVADTAAVTVTATRPALLVLSQAWSPGWGARVAGRTVPVVRVDGLVQGVPVPAGTHRVAFTYHAPGLRAGFALSLGTALALLAAAPVAVLRRRRAGSERL